MAYTAIVTNNVLIGDKAQITVEFSNGLRTFSATYIEDGRVSIADRIADEIRMAERVDEFSSYEVGADVAALAYGRIAEVDALRTAAGLLRGQAPQPK
jgi:hypothetical protein